MMNTRNNKQKSNTLSLNIQSPSMISRSESDVDRKLSEFGAMIMEKLSHMESRLMERIGGVSADVSSLRKELKISLGKIDAVEKKLHGVIDDVMNLKNQLRSFENAAVATDCIVYNIPSSADPSFVVKRAFESFECSTIEPAKVFRIRSKNNSNKHSLPIIIKLKSADDRVKLFKSMAAYRKKFNKNLLLSDVGIEGDVNVSIFESLTKTNRVILNAALDKKRSKNISSAFTVRGNVYIRVDDKDKAVVVHDLKTLETIVGKSTD